MLAKLEDLVNAFVTTSTKKFDRIDKFMEVSTTKFASLKMGLRNHQICIKIKNLVEIVTKRPQRALPPQIVSNPKDPRVGLPAISF
ncbi:unnamed protein product [Linum trigynum]|uniref:Uncharacterized protein n=1 Tax=Linum trigynum TaxID=586398 RepID=A0AAV2F575_9ROSI